MSYKFIVVKTDMSFCSRIDQWKIQRGRGRCGRPLPLLAEHFFAISRLFRVKAYSLLCAFAINDDGTGALSFTHPVSKFLDPPMRLTVSLTTR